MTFTDGYLRALRRDERAGCAAREGVESMPEHVVRAIWYDRLFEEEGLRTDTGIPLRVLFPGWWNRSEGPDFRGAQIQFGGRLVTGDVEIHCGHGCWKQHGHDRDPRYDAVVLEVVMSAQPPTTPPVTSKGRRVACLLLGNYVSDDAEALAARLGTRRGPEEAAASQGRCASLAAAGHTGPLRRLLELAGEWRILAKAQALGERVRRAGPDQTLYEEAMAACGYSRYKEHFRALARGLPYERLRQMVLEDPMLGEAALFHMAGLLPTVEGSDCAHLKRLKQLQEGRLSGLKSLGLTWEKVGVRPNNYPERRLAGAVMFIARTAREGLTACLDRIWSEEHSPASRRKAFAALFPVTMGYWTTHYGWDGKPPARPTAMLGAGRIQSIIGNVFLPGALALARERKDRALEEGVFEFFARFPREPDNALLEAMELRLFGAPKIMKHTFRTQQGMLQLYHDWCRFNPACERCTVHAMLGSAAALGISGPVSVGDS